MTARRFTHIGLPASVVFGAALMTLFVAVLLAGTALQEHPGLHRQQPADQDPEQHEAPTREVFAHGRIG